MEAIVIGDLTIGIRQPWVSCAGKKERVFPRVRDVLVVLSERPNELVAVEDIVAKTGLSDMTVRSYIRYARTALQNCGSALTICYQMRTKGIRRGEAGGKTRFGLVVPVKVGRTIILDEKEQAALRNATTICRRGYPGVAMILDGVISQLGEPDASDVAE